MLEIVKGAEPVFVSVKDLVALGSCSPILPKSSEALEREPIGAAARTLKATVEEVPPPGGGFVTAICALPVLAISEESTVACKSVLLTYLVDNGVPFQRIVELRMKLLPETVNAKPPAPTTAELGFRAAIVGTGFCTRCPAKLLRRIAI